MLGLVELLLVFALVLAWGLHELRSLRRDRLKAKPLPRADDPTPRA